VGNESAGLRARLKRLAELIAGRTGGRLVGRLRRHGCALILAYHNVIPDSERACGDRSLHLSQRIFGDQLDELLQDHDVVPLAEISSQPAGSNRPRASITFDDAYLGTLTGGVEELRRRGLPGTVFVPPGLLGGYPFWWDELAENFSGTLPGELRSHLLTHLAGDQERIRLWARAQGVLLATSLPPWARSATEADLQRAIAYTGLSLGSHSWSHPNLAAVDPGRRRDEMVKSKAWLESRFSTVTIPWLSYPYGLDSAEARKAVSEADYVAALRTTGGHFRPGAVPTQALPRLNVAAGLSAPGFVLRAAGLLSR